MFTKYFRLKYEVSVYVELEIATKRAWQLSSVTGKGIPEWKR
jgi:hypothetical protein